MGTVPLTHLGHGDGSFGPWGHGNGSFDPHETERVHHLGTVPLVHLRRIESGDVSVDQREHAGKNISADQRGCAGEDVFADQRE